MSPTDHKLSWPSTLRRYLLTSAGLHLAWEIAQLPLYTIWSETLARKAVAVLRFTVGDLMIAGLSLAAKPDRPRSGSRDVWLRVLFIGFAYTVYSEWLKVNVRGSWAYAPVMRHSRYSAQVLRRSCNGSCCRHWLCASQPETRRGEALEERKVLAMQNFKSFLGSTSGLVVCSALGLLGLYLLVYHLNHVLLAVPYLVLLACPLMHLMHRGHGNYHHQQESAGKESASGKN